MGVDTSKIEAQLSKDGIVYLPGQHSESDLADICDYLGKSISTLDVKKDDSRTELVFGSGAIEFHTDSPAADFIAWLCVRQDECMTVGAMQFVDTFSIKEYLSPKELSILSSIRIQRRIKDTSHVESSSIIRMEDAKVYIFYAPWLVPKSLGNEENDAIERLKEYIHSTKRTSIRLNPGEVVVIDNRRVLHGRAAISQNSSRHLKRVWIRRFQ